MKKIRRMELLAPAGSYECAKAAAAAGADAIYMGGPLFSARAYAESSKEDMLLRSIRYCHLRGVRVYMTLNTLMKDRELTNIEAYVRPYYEAGLDGVIVQDLGLLGFLRKHFPGLPLHASTQMTVTGPYFTRMLSGFGVTRVVPARELSLEEIKRISDTGIEVEVFSHGALCYAYSGQCLMSSCIGGRSGNRGRCAGPCRLPYDGSYILSMKDLNTLKLLPELWLARASSLKIEGRMKSPVYVAGVCSVYRKYLDRLYGLIGELEPEGEEGRKELLSAWNEKEPIKKDMEILHHEDMESEVMRVAARNGFVDMTGSLLPGIDGFSTRMNVGIVSLMRQCTAYAVRRSHESDRWFGPVLAKGFFDP